MHPPSLKGEEEIPWGEGRGGGKFRREEKEPAIAASSLACPNWAVDTHFSSAHKLSPVNRKLFLIALPHPQRLLFSK